MTFADVSCILPLYFPLFPCCNMSIDHLETCRYYTQADATTPRSLLPSSLKNSKCCASYVALVAPKHGSLVFNPLMLESSCGHQMSSGSLILLTITLELAIILQNISRRFVSNVLINIPPSNMFLVVFLPATFH